MEIPQIILVCLVDKYRLEAAPQAVAPRIKNLSPSFVGAPSPSPFITQSLASASPPSSSALSFFSIRTTQYLTTMRFSFFAFVLLAISSGSVLAAPIEAHGDLVARQNGGNAHSGNSGSVDGGNSIQNSRGGAINNNNSGACDNVLTYSLRLRHILSAFGGTGGRTSTGDATGGDGRGRGSGGNASSGNSGSARGGSVVNNGGSVTNSNGASRAGNGGSSRSGDARGGDAGRGFFAKREPEAAPEPAPEPEAKRPSWYRPSSNGGDASSGNSGNVDGGDVVQIGRPGGTISNSGGSGPSPTCAPCAVHQS